MKVRKYHPVFSEALVSFWNDLGKNIPYFFAVSQKKWEESLFDDCLDGEKKFSSLDTFVAVDQRKIVGFLQCGQPDFAWTKDGEKYRNPQIGVIRHFYFEQDRLDVANELFAKAADFMDQFPDHYAFYQIFGMSCNAHHGKLHHSMVHVDQFLRKNGFKIDQENVYFSLDIRRYQTIQHNDLRLISKPVKFDSQEYDIDLEEIHIGSVQVRFLQNLTGEKTSDKAYLIWIGIKEPFQRKGWGTKVMHLLISELRRKGVRYIHLDTAITNVSAQCFYEHLGFQNGGRTRSYYKSNLDVSLKL
jgi:ribosomal protein S18 acetylase RimI-like enzyme